MPAKADILCHRAGTILPPSTLVSVGHFPSVVVCSTPSTLEERMYDVAEKMARLGRLRNAALLAVVIPAALVAGCSSQPPPPPQQPVAAAPPPPPPPPMPAVRG